MWKIAALLFCYTWSTNLRSADEETDLYGGWTGYRLRVVDDHIQTWVNGVKITDYVEKDLEIVKATGQIFLQIHSAPYPQELLYKDLYLKEL